MTTDSSSDIGRIYLDANATTRPWPEVIETIAHHLRHSYGNPGSRHAEGRQARRVLEESRETLASLLGAEPREVVFTSGGTEASNMALSGLTSGPPGTIGTTAGEHPATTETCATLVQQGWSLHNFEVDSNGLLTAEQFSTLPTDDLRLATVILAHNETGIVQDLELLSQLCSRHNVPFHVDAVQAVGKIPVNFRKIGASSLALGAHKFHGPRGIGALLLRDGTRLSPIQFGGHQESGRRPGTEMVALAAGMARALELCCQDMGSRTAELQALRNQLEAGLQNACDPVVVNGSDAGRLPNTLNISFPGADGEALLAALDLEGIACSLGSTCASGSAEPAPVLVAMGRSPEVYRSAVRFSVHNDLSSADMDEAIARIARIVKRNRQLCAQSSAD
ncbi:MAG: cysteine desulfurase family protein [Planctomycetaceae bacterium]